MAPKRKSHAVKGAAPGAAKASQVPKLIIAGGVEVLGVRTGPDSIIQIEAYLNPRMGLPTSDDFYGYSDNITVSTDFKADTPKLAELPRYSMATIELPMLNEDLTCSEILMWECISVKTEVVGINTLINCHSAAMREYPDGGNGEGAGFPIQGMNYHFFAVGGEALDLQFTVSNYRANYPAGVEVLKGLPKSAQVLDSGLKGKLTADDSFPIECWVADPSKNENTRYYGSYTGGLQTPPVLQFTNSTTTILLNENGVGPLCKGDKMFLSSADIVGFQTQQNKKMKYRGLARYFNVTLRKRIVKNPYPVSTLLSTLFSQMQPVIHGQTMTGSDAQVEEVRVYQGTEKLPGDPDMIRYRSQLGEEITVPPGGHVPHN
ncbi:VP1 protein [Rousettus aegyptiacus polyomavirus 1]|uniref:Capsid protein VP1 n=30 Tax=Polyomaviridae TaxID=151341 RepID=A0A1S7J020_9POLY|nr:VP1 protein [Rousettus aegyptiacus polyomavirus 1]BAX01892.1 VP1 protein [Rousettus aegyptiacus polyomavirus 1]